VNESDYYRLARLVGALFWPALLGLLVLFLGRAAAQVGPPARRQKIRRWAAVLGAFAFVTALALSVGDLIVRSGGR
jgi:hypothetical protein